MADGMAPRLGFGASGPHGQAWFSEAKFRTLIADAIAGGIRHFDTGPSYHDAEARLGAALKAAASEVFVSTKTGTRREGRRLIKDFSERAIRTDVDASLRRLGRSRLDLLYLHGPTPQQAEEIKPLLDRMKAEGLLAAIGVCGEDQALRHAVALRYDWIMGPYNLIDQRHAPIFEAARQSGVGTVSVAPLAQGVFDPKFNRPESLADLWRIARYRFRGRYRREKVMAARRALGDPPPVDAALGFVLANPDIDIVMATTTKTAHLAQLLAARPSAGPDSAALKAIALTLADGAPS